MFRRHKGDSRPIGQEIVGMITRTLGRPREFDEGTVLGEMMAAFWDGGYEGTSLSDLVHVSKINKGSLYAAFGSKRQIYLKALERYLDFLVTSIDEALKAPGIATDHLRSLFHVSAERVAAGDRRGCFLCNASTDMAASDTDVEELVRSGLQRLERLFGNALGPGLSARQRSAKASQLLSTYMGIQALARAGYPERSIRSIIDQTLP